MSAVSRIVGALVGAEVERKRGESGLKGAVIGAVAMGALRRLGPVGLVLGGAYVARQAWKRRRARRGANVGR